MDILIFTEAVSTKEWCHLGKQHSMAEFLITDTFNRSTQVESGIAGEKQMQSQGAEVWKGRVPYERTRVTG